MDTEQEEADRLLAIFGSKAELVVDEILDKAHSGYEYDADLEAPFYQKVKKILKDT